MKKLFLLLGCSFLISFISAQEKKELNIGINDSIIQDFQLKIAQKKKEKKIKVEHFLQNANPDSVRTMNLSGAGFNELPDISNFNMIILLDASGNEIITVNKNLLAFDHLKNINLSENRIKRFTLPKNNIVTTLNLSENGLRRIPRSIRKLKKLQYLDLAQNKIKRIPRFLIKLDSLSEINLNFNSLKLKEKSIKRMAKIATLQLAGNNIKNLPVNIDRLYGVKKLNLSKNQLCKLPSSFENLTGLTSLIFYQNKFVMIPEEALGLINLVELDFYYNQITEIPEGIGNLIKLEQLFLSFNDIRVIPDTIQKLIALKYLYIHHNQLTTLPEWITSFTNLQRLDVSYNHLVSLPDLSKMESLKELDIQENELAHFPWKLLDKKGLEILVAKNNPYILDIKEKQYLESLKNNLNSSSLVLVY